MKTMNLFGTKEKPKRKTYSDNFKRKTVALANKIGNSNAAKELGVSTNSISNWRKAINPAPIQDSEGNLTFSLDNHIYTLNVNSEEERNSTLAQVNSNSEYTWNWFKEEIGKKHWVLYNTEMYEEEKNSLFNFSNHSDLRYKENSNLAPTIPINTTSCRGMFNNCYELTTLDLSNFDTSKVTNMDFMFNSCSSLTTLDVTNFDTSNVTDMDFMFSGCDSLTTLDATNFDISKVFSMNHMFDVCTSLKTIKATDPKLINYIRENYPQIQIA